MPLQAIHFTQEQACVLTGVSLGDLRQWRKAVPYLMAKPGKAARFTFADLVGLAIAGEVTGPMGVRVSSLGVGLNVLFATLADARPAHLDGLVAIVSVTTAALIKVDKLSGRRLSEPAIVIPCDPIIARIRAQMIPFAPGTDQTALPFPPRVLKTRS